MKIKFTRKSFIVLVVLCSCSAYSQTKTNYFAQEFPKEIPVRFAPGKVSTKLHEHSRIEFSNDGTEMYWSVYPVPFSSGSQFIKYSIYQSGNWSEPDTISFSGRYRDGSPSFSNDNNYLYFDSWRPLKPNDEENKFGGIWRSKRIASNTANESNLNWFWSEPEYYLSLNQKPYVTNTFIFTGNNSIYFDSGPRTDEGVPKWAINVFRIEDGNYTKPQKLGHQINTTKISWTPFVDKDETFIIFSAHKREDDPLYKGNGDLYISFKNENGRWSKSMNMGDKINTSAQERFPSISPDGKYLFFARHTKKNYSDIFWVDAKIIEEFRD